MSHEHTVYGGWQHQTKQMVHTCLPDSLLCTILIRICGCMQAWRHVTYGRDVDSKDHRMAAHHLEAHSLHIYIPLSNLCPWIYTQPYVIIFWQRRLCGAVPATAGAPDLIVVTSNTYCPCAMPQCCSYLCYKRQTLLSPNPCLTIERLTGHHRDGSASSPLRASVSLRLVVTTSTADSADLAAVTVPSMKRSSSCAASANACHFLGQPLSLKAHAH